MPRPSYNSIMDDILGEFAYMKNPSTDLFGDFEYILKYQLDRFRECLLESTQQKLDAKLKAAKKFKTGFQNKNRVYLITDMDIPELILYNIDECIIDNMKFTCDLIGVEDYDIEVDRRLCCTLFIFSGKKFYTKDLFAKTSTELIRCFHSENLLSNAKIRDSWYAQPRRKSRC